MICSAQMQPKPDVRYRMLDTRKIKDEHRKSNFKNRKLGFTMAELLVVLAIVSLFVLMAQIHLFGLLRKSTFRAQTQELVSTMQMAASAAAETGRRYEIMIDISEQAYELKQITGSEINVDRPDETPGEVIVQNNLTENCRLVYVWFDDGIDTNTRAWFRVGPSGWQNGGKIILLDEKDQPYTIVVNRINRIVVLEEGNIELLEPKSKNDLPF
ncbi:MAG: prepilin-type N-terminal cleavage/methylation domain-containing protein [Sedimentisphaerales bacterium]|nr:prepilin-type N-terminal cleavage/methylation domain-containing protein [Sedimentisphaerales bacterium]